jgi:hypothetical protein
MSQWWDIVLPEIDSLSLESELARNGDMDAAGRAQIGYRSMTLTCEWLKDSGDQAAVASACVASYEAVDAGARAALGEVATSAAGIPVHLESRMAASNAWMHLASRTMRSDELRADEVPRPNNPPRSGLTGGQHRSIKMMMQDRAAPETASALLGAARDRNAVVTIDEDYPGGLIVVSMSTTTPGVGMLVAWAPSMYLGEWLQTTKPQPCDGYKVTLMTDDGKTLGNTFVGPADLAGMTGDPSGRVDYLQHKFKDDLQRFGQQRVASWS